MQNHKVDVQSGTAKEYLIDESYVRPVLVDFWADWCGPCKSLMPILEKLAEEYAGAFLLAKVNADAEPMVVAHFGVRSLPTVMLMRDGQPVDGFTGAQSEAEVRRFLEPHLPKPWDEDLQAGLVLLEQGEASQALIRLKSAYEQSSQHSDIACVLASAYIQAHRLDEAETVLSGVRLAERGPAYQQALAQLDLARSAAKAPEIQDLEVRLQQDPDNADLIFQLAVQYSQHQYHKDALALLFRLLQANLGARDGDVRRTFNDVIAILGKGDPLAVEYQRKLYSLLY